ncbi:hypothetical protein [Caballeronia arationis]|nr:hypothetical protein [Caballeronia arationis]
MIEQLKHAIHYHCGHIINKTEGGKDHKPLWQRATQQQRDEAREGVFV